MTMRRKLYSQAYFLINFNETYAHSMGVRIKYIGLNSMIIGWAVSRLYFNVNRLPVLIYHLYIRQLKENHLNEFLIEYWLKIQTPKPYIYNTKKLTIISI